MKVIVGIGTINVDLIAYMENFPRIGETIRSFKFCVSPGGKVSNAVVTTARLSHWI